MIKKPDKELMLLRKRSQSMKNKTRNTVVKISRYLHRVTLLLLLTWLFDFYKVCNTLFFCNILYTLFFSHLFNLSLTSNIKDDCTLTNQYTDVMTKFSKMPLYRCILKKKKGQHKTETISRLEKRYFMQHRWYHIPHS